MAARRGVEPLAPSPQAGEPRTGGGPRQDPAVPDAGHGRPSAGRGERRLLNQRAAGLMPAVSTAGIKPAARSGRGTLMDVPDCLFCRKLAALDDLPPEEVVWRFPHS